MLSVELLELQNKEIELLRLETRKRELEEERRRLLE
jgi:hypothetical protein